jgi:hypothetical protein
VEDDILHTPFKSERTDNYFENRDRLYRNDGPTALGTIGIWEWTAIPNRDNPAIDYVQSYYVKDYSPVRVVVLMAKSLDEVVEQLQFLLVRGDDRSTIHFRSRARHGQHHTHGRPATVEFAEMLEIVVPRIALLVG